MPRTRSKRMRRYRSRHIRHRGKKTRVGRRKNRRKRVSRRVMRGGVDNPLAGITKMFGKTKRLKQVPPGKQPGDDDFTLGVFGDSKDKTEGDTKSQIKYTANKLDSNKPDSSKPRRGTKNSKAPDAKNLPDATKLFGIPEEEKKAKIEEIAQMKAKQEKKKSQGTFAESIEQDKKGHNKTDKKLNKQLSGLRKMVGQTSTSQSSTYGMTCVEPIPNSPGSYKVLDKDGIWKHLI